MLPSRMLRSERPAGRKTLWLLLQLMILSGDDGGVEALKDVEVIVPQAVKVGDTVTLQCRYNLEDEPLYTLKWYKGSREFYRYIPKELPSTQVFPFQDIDVDLAKSNENSIVLRNLKPEHTGRYRCEVSSDAPNFYTLAVEGFMYVLDVPEGKPEVFIEKDMYEIGYTLRGNCTSPPSYPAINLTWFLNEKKVNESFMMRLADPDNPEDRRNPLTTVAGLELEIDGATFQSGKARIRCVADLFNIYQAQEDVVLEEERPRPRPSSVLGTRDSSGSTWLRATFLMNTAIVLSLIIR